MERVVKNWFRFSMVMAFLLGSMTSAVQADNVVFRLINLDGVPITGDVQGARQYSAIPPWTASPATFDVGSLPTNVTVNSKFIGLFGSTVPQQSVTTTNKIVSGDSLVIDGLSKAELFRGPSGSGNTSVNIVYNAVKPTFGTVGINGNDLTGGQIIFPTFSQTHNTPYTPAGFVMHNYGISVRGRVGTNETPTKTINVKRNTIATIDGQNVSNVTELPYSGSRVNFKFGVFVLPVTLVNNSGDPITGDIKIASGTFQPSPVTLFNQLPGAQVAIQGRVGTTTSATKVVALHPDSTFSISWGGTVNASHTPGAGKVNVVYSQLAFDVVVRDLNGAIIYNLDGVTKMGQVSVVGQTTGFVPTGFVGNIQSGGTIDVKGRFDDLTSSKLVRIVKDSTSVVSAGNGVVSRIYTPGQTRVEFRFDAIVFTTEVVSDLGYNLDNALVRVVDYTDVVTGVPTFVASPFKVKIRAGNDLNIEVKYANYEEQFDILSVGGTVFLFDQNGNPNGTTTTDLDKGGARAVVDDAPVTIRTTNGIAPVAGQIKLGGGVFQNSPLVSVPALDGDVYNIEAQYNGVLMDNVDVTVKEDFTQIVNAANGTITEQSTPGTTLIDISFAEMTVNVLATDLNGNPILGLNGTTVLGEVFVNGLTPTYVPSGYTFNAISGQTFGFRGRFDDLASEFQGVQVIKGKTVAINVATGTVGAPVNTPNGSTRIEMQFDPVVFTTDVLNDLGQNLSIATVRLVAITDVGGQPTFVTSPYLAVLRNGRLLNVEVAYGLFETQFDIHVVGASIQEFDLNGQATGSSSAPSGEGGARAIVDDASVTIQTVDGTTPVAGEINVALYTTLFEGSPVTIDAIPDGTPINISAKYNGVTLSTVSVAVTEDHTITVNARNGTVGQPVSTPGTTLINLDFKSNVAPVLSALTKPTSPSIPLTTSDVTVQGPVFDADGNLVSVVVTLDEGTPNEVVVLATLTENNTLFTAEFTGVSNGLHALKIVATDAFDATDTKTSAFLVQANLAPVAVIAGDETLNHYCLANSMYLELDGSQSSDPDGDSPLIYRWKDGGNILHQGVDGEGNKPTLLIGVGTRVITLEVEDPSGAVGTDQVTVTIQNDTEAPVVTISEPNDGDWVKGTSIKLSGSITDNTKLKNVKIDDRTASFSGPNGNYNFTGTARLVAGQNGVNVVALDFAGNEGTASMTLHADVKKPVSDVENATLTPMSPAGAAFVSGFLSAEENEVQVKVHVNLSDYNDDNNTTSGSGVDIPNVMIGGESVTLVSGDMINGVYEATVTLTGNGNKNIKVWVGDNVGHRLDSYIALKLDTRLPQARISSPSNNALVTTPTVTVMGDAWDDGNANEVAAIDVNGVAGAFTGNEREFRAENVTPNLDGSIVVTVTDLAGKTNTTSVVVNHQGGGNGGPASIKLTLISSVETGGQPIEGARVDLLEVRDGNERGTGKKQNTNASGMVEFEVEGSKIYRLRVVHNQGKYTTGDMTSAVNNDVTVQTLLSTFTFANSVGAYLGEVRVDLMDGSGEHLCLKHETDGNGVAAFEILPGLEIRFRVHWMAATWISPTAIVAGGDESLQTKEATLHLTTSTSAPIDGVRVDLRNDTGDHLCKKENTDGSGVAAFEVLPNMQYRFMVHYRGGNFLLNNILTDGQDDNLQTVLTSLTLNDHNGTGNPIDDARVDLLKEDESGVGVNAKTGQSGHGAGIAGFEVLPNFVHKFKVSYNGGTYITASVTP